MLAPGHDLRHRLQGLLDRSSTRRFQSDLEDAFAKGYLAKLPHYNTVLNYFEDPEVTPILNELIVQSSLPLKAIEARLRR